jgi:DNA-binding transcriptional regulator YdaS (Cro superfamily)
MDHAKNSLEGLERAVKVAGGTNALSRALGLTPGVVAQWRKAGRVPAERVPAIARITGVPPEALRADLFSYPIVSGLAESQAPYAAEARELGIDAAAVAAEAVRAAIAAERARRWSADNRAALEAHARYVEEHGLPLDSHRMF